MTTVDITGQLARYMARARELNLSPDVAREARHRILDALAAMVSGSHLPPGDMAVRFARAQGGTAEATVLTTDIRTSAVNAALRKAKDVKDAFAAARELVTKRELRERFEPSNPQMAGGENVQPLLVARP